MKYLELIKKTIVVTITIIVTLIVLWIVVGLFMKNSMKEVPLRDHQEVRTIGR